jgi:copper chaperone NosL
MPGTLRRPRILHAFVAVLAALVVAGCTPSPEPIHAGSDECAQCRMRIEEPRFAAQTLNDKGRSWKFDSIECMTAFLAGSALPAAQLHSAWVADFNDPDTWLPVEEAHFLRSERLSSPMGGGLTAYGSAEAAAAARAEFGGQVLRWTALRAMEIRHEHPRHAGHDAHPEAAVIPAALPAPAPTAPACHGGAAAQQESADG